VATKPANPSIVNIASVCGLRGFSQECISYQVPRLTGLPDPTDLAQQRGPESTPEPECSPRCVTMMRACDRCKCQRAAVQASKVGVVGLTLSGAAKLVLHGIRVNAVSPSVTLTVRPVQEQRYSVLTHWQL